MTPNAPMSGAEVRSTEASAPLAGWAAATCRLLSLVVSGFPRGVDHSSLGLRLL